MPPLKGKRAKKKRQKESGCTRETGKKEGTTTPPQTAHSKAQHKTALRKQKNSALHCTERTKQSTTSTTSTRSTKEGSALYQLNEATKPPLCTESP